MTRQDRFKKNSFIKLLKVEPLAAGEEICAMCYYRIRSYTDSLFFDLGIPFPKQLKQATANRKASFLAGRKAAKEALSALNASDVMIDIGPGGAPVWPNYVSGSISHTEAVALCILSSGRQRIGLDVAEMLTEDILYEIRNVIMSKAERSYVRQCNDIECRMETVIFSAKECIYKALYPEVQSYFDFLDVETVNIDFNNKQVTFRLCKTLAASLPRETRLTVSWKSSDDYVFTYILDEHINPLAV